MKSHFDLGIIVVQQGSNTVLYSKTRFVACPPCMTAMERDKSIYILSLALLCVACGVRGEDGFVKDDGDTGAADRQVHLVALEQISRPVLGNLSLCTLNLNMLNQTKDGAYRTCPDYRVAAAFARLISGIAPWLELGASDNSTDEGKLRAEFIDLTNKAFYNVFVNQTCRDFVHWNQCHGMVVEAAFVGHSLLRMPKTVQAMSSELKEAMAINLQLTFTFSPPTWNNWCNFPSILQAGLWYHNLSNGTSYIYTAIKLQEEWYKG
eukprot:scpid52340/ scgid9933/ 